MEKLKILPFPRWIKAIEGESYVTHVAIIRIKKGAWQCVAKIIDPENGELYYRVGDYAGRKPKQMAQAGSWLKIIEDALPQSASLAFHIEIDIEKGEPHDISIT